MSYDTADQSEYNGEPVQLIEFSYQDTFWRYTTNISDITSGGYTWSAIPISGIDKTKLQQGKKQTPAKITVTIDNAVATLFRTAALESTMNVTVYEGHVDDGDYELIHSGRIIQREVEIKSGKKLAHLISEPLITSTTRPSLKLRWGKTCPYVLYDSATCKATKTPVVATLDGISGTSLTIAAAASITSGDLVAGYIQTTTEKRMITAHSGSSVTITTAFSGASVGQSCILYIGCNHTDDDCNNKHSNILNYGGEPQIPNKNPFQGRI